MRRFWLFLILFLLPFKSALAQGCIEKTQTLKQKNESLLLEGGSWEIFEKNQELQNSSSKGLKLDAQINRIIELTDYLCTTLNGVPLNELATYIMGELKSIGEQKLRKLLRSFGKPDAEIDSWLRYSKIALQLQKRTLDKVSFNQTLGKAQKLIMQYEKLLNNNRTETTSNGLIVDTLDLTRQIKTFFIMDPNLVKAIKEKAAEPFWDPDENYGGS